VKELWRLGKIIRILIKHGFGNIAERLFKRTETSPIDQEEKELTAHFHARHSKIDKRFGYALLPGQGNGELEICHGFNRFGADIKNDISVLKLLCTRAMMDIAIYHLGMIHCLCCYWKHNRKEKKHADP